jgi:hypothetical protein
VIVHASAYHQPIASPSITHPGKTDDGKNPAYPPRSSGRKMASATKTKTAIDRKNRFDSFFIDQCFA